MSKENNLAKIVVFTITISVLVILIIIAGIFDKKISEFIYNDKNFEIFWDFSQVFEYIGKTLYVAIVYFTALIFSKKIVNKHWMYFFKKKYIYWIIEILFMLILLLATQLEIIRYGKSEISQKYGKSYFLTSIIMLVIYFIILTTFLFLFNFRVLNNPTLINKLYSSLTRLFIFSIMSFITLLLFKYIFGRNRPFEVLNYGYKFTWPFQINFSEHRSESFPSGHVVSAVNSTIGFLFFLNIKNKKTKWKFYILLAISILFVVIVAISRVMGLYHYSSDVIFSLIICYIYFSTNKLIFNKIIFSLNKRRSK